MRIFDILSGPSSSEPDTELEEFKAKREYEREVFDSALKNWILQSGLGPIMLEQTQEYADKLEGDGWPDQFDMYRTHQFDPRRDNCEEIIEFIDDELVAADQNAVYKIGFEADVVWTDEDVESFIEEFEFEF